MDIERFQDSPVGGLQPIRVQEDGEWVDHFAFVPSPLPETVDLGTRTIGAAIEAGQHLGRLDAIAGLLPNPLLLVRPTIRREAVATSALEGTYTPAAQVLSSEVDEQSPPTQAVTEVLNFIRANERAIELLDDLPICVRMLSELQETLVTGTPSEDWQAGKVRETQVVIGPHEGCGVLEAHFIPPPPGPDLEEALADWERWIHADSDVHPIIRVSLAHYQFEALHPYTDGNGRIGRLVATLQLIDYGILAYPIVNLSPFFEARQDQYRNLLSEVSAVGAFDQWVGFFCEGLRSEAAQAELRARNLLAWRDETLELLRGQRVRGTALDVAAELISYPSLTVRLVADRHGVSNQAANNAVARLVELGVIQEVTGRSYNRVFQASDVLEIIFRSSHIAG